MASVAGKLPFSRFEEQMMNYLDGSLGVGFALTGVDISCASPEAVNTFNQKLENLLTGLQEGLRLQVFYRMTNNAFASIESHRSISSGCDPSYLPIRESRIAQLERKLETGRFFVPEIYLFVRSAPLQLKKRRLFDKKNDFQPLPEADLKRHTDHFQNVVAQLEAGLTSADLAPRRLTEEEWFTLCFSYFNFERSETIGNPTLRETSEPLVASLSSQVCLTDISVSEKHLSIGNLEFRVVTMGLLPEGQTFASMIEALTSLPFHFWISQNIHSLDQRKEISKLELMRRVASSMASGSQNVSDIESESKLSSLEDLLREIMNGSERLVACDLNVIIWGETNDQLERKTEEVLRAFRSMGQAEGLVETFALEDAFFRAAPSVCEGLRLKRMKSSNCSHLAPLYAPWRGNNEPVVLLSTREGAPFAIAPFAKELPNWNGLVFGGSGAGKSFTICQLMLQFCSQAPKPKIVWLDNGASSQKLIEVLGGEFVDLHLESGVCLNMFDPDVGTEGPSSDKIKLILGCMEMILKDEEKHGLPKRDKALLEEAIVRCYTKVRDRIPQLSDLRDILKEHPAQELKRYADILYSWTGDTAFGRMLDGPTNVKLTKDFVCFERKGLENHRELNDVFMHLLFRYTRNEAASDLSRPYLIVFDEAERLFKSSRIGRETSIDSFRVLRKLNAGIWCISQNYKDFLSDPELANSLLPNSTFIFILRQRKIDWEDFRNTFDFTDAQVDAAKSLEIVKGKHSEFLLLQDENQAVVRLEPDPLSYWICTSDGLDKVKVEELRTANPGRPLLDILVDYTKGDTH